MKRVKRNNNNNNKIKKNNKKEIKIVKKKYEKGKEKEKWRRLIRKYQMDK